MPLEWKPNRNPYKHSFFGILQVGANTPRNQINAIGADIKKRIVNTGRYETAGVEVAEQDVSEAVKFLSMDESRVAEQLLVHAEPRKEGKNLQQVNAAIKAATDVSLTHAPLPLRSFNSLLWFLPPPTEKNLPWPTFGELGLVGPTAPEDLDMDIVFDM